MGQRILWLAVVLGVVSSLTLQGRMQRGGTAQAPPADLVLTNGRIVTVDDARPEAPAMAVSGGRVEALGSLDEIKRLVGPHTTVSDLPGQPAGPGFIESPGDFTGVGGA